MPSDSHALKPAPVADRSNPDPVRTVTPQARAARRDFGRILSRAITSARSSQRLTAEAIGVSRARLAQYLDGESSIRPEQLLALPPRVLAAVAEQLACVADTRSTRSHGLPLDTLVARLAAELGDVARTSPDDLPRMLAEVEDVARMAAQAAADIRERITVRG